MGFNTPGAASSAADLEAQDPPKSRPKPEKNDVKKQHVFGIDFGRSWASKSAALLAAPGVLKPTAFFACINILLFLA